MTKRNQPTSAACPEFLAAFSDFLDGRLPAAERGAIQAHLDCCPGCLKHLAAYRRGITVLRSAPEIPASPDFWPRLERRLWLGHELIGGRDIHASSAGRRERSRTRSWRPTLAAAVVAFLALGVLWSVGAEGPVPAWRSSGADRAGSDPAAPPVSVASLVPSLPSWAQADAVSDRAARTKRIGSPPAEDEAVGGRAMGADVAARGVRLPIEASARVRLARPIRSMSSAGSVASWSTPAVTGAPGLELADWRGPGWSDVGRSTIRPRMTPVAYRRTPTPWPLEAAFSLP